MVFRADWLFVLFFASNVWLIGRYYEAIVAALNSRKWAVLVCALSSMTMVFRADWLFVLFFASNVWLIGRYYEAIVAALNSRKWAVLVCALAFAAFVLFVYRVGLVQGSVIPFAQRN